MFAVFFLSRGLGPERGVFACSWCSFQLYLYRQRVVTHPRAVDSKDTQTNLAQVNDKTHEHTNLQTQIDDELNKTISGFQALEQYLEERRLAAEAADQEEEEELARNHLKVCAIPPA